MRFFSCSLIRTTLADDISIGEVADAYAFVCGYRVDFTVESVAKLIGLFDSCVRTSTKRAPMLTIHIRSKKEHHIGIIDEHSLLVNNKVYSCNRNIADVLEFRRNIDLAILTKHK